MKRIVSIGLGPSAADQAFTTRFLGRDFHVRRLGTDGDVEQALALLARWQGDCDAIGLGDVVDHQAVGTRRLDDATTARLEAAVSEVPVTTGATLRTFLDEWTVRHIQNNSRQYFTNARVLFLSGLSSFRLAQALAEYTPNVCFADPIEQAGIPRVLSSLQALEAWAAAGAAAAGLRRWVPRAALPGAAGGVRAAWNRLALREALQRASVVVAPHDALGRFGLEELGGKIVLTSAIPDEGLRRLAARGVDVVIDRVPKLLDRVVGLDVVEAMIIAALDRGHPDEVQHDDYLEVFGALALEPRVLFPSGKPHRVNRFAFVIHPLSREYLKTVKVVDLVTRYAPPAVLRGIEKLLAYSPPFVYSHVTGIRSPTGVEAEGWLITVGGTPRELLSHTPEFTYRRLLAAARMAERLGAQVMGLGAFTKVVGDAGVTVARQAPIPVTTGNSYSASGALWAAADAVRRMGLLSRNARGQLAGKAMVVGATGAIGSVCARLLAMAVEEVHLVSPEVAKLLTLRESILAETPGARLQLRSRAGESVRDMDLIVTATSGAGKRILDITQVKPGCVITDVARPLDLPPSEVAKRPDVLVIESGEIELPGDVQMRNIGLPPGIAYACLAETIVLALEGRFESFTVGRNIQWEKVKEIYQLGLKHGMRLAAISGVNGVFTDDDIRRVRELALAARAGQRTARAEDRAAEPEWEPLTHVSATPGEPTATPRHAS